MFRVWIRPPIGCQVARNGPWTVRITTRQPCIDFNWRSTVRRMTLGSTCANGPRAWSFVMVSTWGATGLRRVPNTPCICRRRYSTAETMKYASFGTRAILVGNFYAIGCAFSWNWLRGSFQNHVCVVFEHIELLSGKVRLSKLFGDMCCAMLSLVQPIGRVCRTHDGVQGFEGRHFAGWDWKKRRWKDIWKTACSDEGIAPVRHVGCGEQNGTLCICDASEKHTYEVATRCGLTCAGRPTSAVWICLNFASQAHCIRSLQCFPAHSSSCFSLQILVFELHKGHDRLTLVERPIYHFMDKRVGLWLDKTVVPIERLWFSLICFDSIWMLDPDCLIIIAAQISWHRWWECLWCADHVVLF